MIRIIGLSLLLCTACSMPDPAVEAVASKRAPIELLSSAAIERGRLIGVLDAVAAQGRQLSTMDLRLMEQGTAPVLPDIPLAFRHRNGVYQMPSGLQEKVAASARNPAHTNQLLPGRLRYFEALVRHRMYDPQSSIHQILRREYEHYGSSSELASSHRCAEACEVECRLIATEGTNTSNTLPVSGERCPVVTRPECTEKGPRTQSGAIHGEGGGRVRCDDKHKLGVFGQPKRCLNAGGVVTNTIQSGCARKATTRISCIGLGDCDRVRLRPKGLDTAVLRNRAKGRIGGRPPRTNSATTAQSSVQMRNWNSGNEISVPSGAKTEVEETACGRVVRASIGCSVEVKSAAIPKCSAGFSIDLRELACTVVESFSDRSPKPSTHAFDAYSTEDDTTEALVLRPVNQTDPQGRRIFKGSVSNGFIEATSTYDASVKILLSYNGSGVGDTYVDSNRNGTMAEAEASTFARVTRTLTKVRVEDGTPQSVEEGGPLRPISVRIAGSEFQDNNGNPVNRPYRMFYTGSSVSTYCGSCNGAGCRFGDADTGPTAPPLEEDLTEVEQPHVEFGGCASDNDCDEGMICGQGCQCVARPPCQSDDECPEGEICMAGVCTPPECRQDSDCEEGMRCTDGRCEIDPCTGNDDCPQGQICHQSVCQPPLVQCAACDEQNENPCEGDLRCWDGVCRGAPFCDNENPCCEGKICDYDGEIGECVTEARGCDDQNPCPQGQVCQAGACVEPDCSDQRPCQPGQECIDGRCEEMNSDECGPGLPPCPQDRPCCRAEMCGERIQGEDCPQ